MNVLPKVPCNNKINYFVNMIIILPSTSESNISCCLKCSHSIVFAVVLNFRKAVCDEETSQALQQMPLCVFLESLPCANTIWSEFAKLKIHLASHTRVRLMKQMTLLSRGSCKRVRSSP